MRNVFTENLARLQGEKLIGLLASCYLNYLLWQIILNSCGEADQ